MKYCHNCKEEKSIDNFNKNGHGGHRAMCKSCETTSRLETKRKKLKSSKNIIATNGGSTPSRQKVVRV